MAFPWKNLDAPLLKLGPGAHLSTRQALEGLHIWGGIGSGKTSGSGKAVASALLRAGFGGVICTAKPEEVGRWLDYARKNGRSKSVVVFDATRGYNFIQHELSRQGTQGLANVVECLVRVLDMATHATGAGGRESDAFWLESIRQILNHAIPVLYGAHRTVTVASILDFVTTAATKPELYTDKDWVSANFAGQTLRRLAEDPAVAMPHAIRHAMLEYWIRQYPNIPEKTRGNIIISLTTKLDRFKHGRLGSCFCDRTDILPEMTFHGAIIILAMPALTWNDDGIIGQQLFKYMWMRTVESRNGLPPAQRERPVFLYADEAQYFANSYDDSFLSTCRGSRAAVVYMTQTLPAYYARFGKDKTDAADGLVGKFTTHIFHLNACTRTNKFASDLIGRGIQSRATQGYSHGTNTSRSLNEGRNTNYGRSSGSSTSLGGPNASSSHNSGTTSGDGEAWGATVGRGGNEGQSWSHAETMDNLVEPRFFATALKPGGPANGGEVTALWFRAGARFAGGDNVLLARFRQ